MNSYFLKIYKNKALFGYLMVLLSTVGFASYGIWSKNIGADFGVFTQGWVRSLIALAILLPLGILTKQFKKVDKKDWRWVLMPMLFGVFTQAPLYYAFNNMSIGTAVLIFFSMFLITSYTFGYLFIGEKMTVVKIVALILAITGLVITFGIELGVFSLLALCLAGINGIASGGEVTLTQKVTKKYSSFQISTLVWVGILITHIPAAVIAGEPSVAIAFNLVWVSMFAYAITGLLSFWFVVEGFRFIDASIGGLIGLLEVIFAVIFGVIFFGEAITVSTLIGGGLIIFAAMLPNLVDIIKRRDSKII